VKYTQQQLSQSFSETSFDSFFLLGIVVVHVVKVGFSKKKIITGPMVPGNSIKVKIAENGFG